MNTDILTLILSYIEARCEQLIAETQVLSDPASERKRCHELRLVLYEKVRGIEKQTSS